MERRSGSWIRLYRANHEFHSFVQALAANRWLDRVTSDLRRFMRLMRGRQRALPDLGKVETSHARFRQGEVARSRAVTTAG